MIPVVYREELKDIDCITDGLYQIVYLGFRQAKDNFEIGFTIPVIDNGRLLPNNNSLIDYLRKYGYNY